MRSPLVSSHPPAWRAASLSSNCVQISQQIQLAKSKPELFVPPEGQRSPSPPPQYDEAGVRINMRALRAVEKLSVQAQVQLDPDPYITALLHRESRLHWLSSSDTPVHDGCVAVHSCLAWLLDVVQNGTHCG